jgi:hypothetical protein
MGLMKKMFREFFDRNLIKNNERLPVEVDS